MRGTKRNILTGSHICVCSLTEEKSGTLSWWKYFLFFLHTSGFFSLKTSACHRSAWSSFLGCPGKRGHCCKREDGKGQKRKGSSFSGTQQQSWEVPGTQLCAALKLCQINFLPVGTMTTSGNGIALKGNKQGNCIFYCQCINFIVWNMNSFSAVALGSLCVHVQVQGTWEGLSLVPAEQGRGHRDFPVAVLVHDPSWPLGSTADVQCTSTGSHLHERGRCLQTHCSCLS